MSAFTAISVKKTFTHNGEEDIANGNFGSVTEFPKHLLRRELESDEMIQSETATHVEQTLEGLRWVG